MLKRVAWTENAVFSLRLRDDLYTLAQMRKNHILQFFDIRTPDGKWTNVDLNSEPDLFFCFVAENKLKPLFAEKVDDYHVKPSHSEIPRKMLSAVMDPRNYGANLIELTSDYSSFEAKTLKINLSPTTDLRTIHSHELIGMVGDPEKLRHRLIRFFDTGVNWDDAKSCLFKGIQLPEPAPMS